MRTRIGWGSNFMAKFSTEGAMKGSEPDEILTPTTEISSNKNQEACDMEIADALSINQEDQEDPAAEIDITEIMHSMKRGKRSTRQRVKISAPWAHPFGFLNSSRVRGAHRSNNQGVVGSKKMKRTRRGTRSRRVNTRAAKGKRIVGGEGDSNSSDHFAPAEAATSDNSRVEESDPEPLHADSMASCVEFAVKLLKDEVPLPAETSEVEEFFKQTICRQKSKIPGPSQSSLSRNV